MSDHQVQIDLPMRSVSPIGNLQVFKNDERNDGQLETLNDDETDPRLLCWGRECMNKTSSGVAEKVDLDKNRLEKKPQKLEQSTRKSRLPRPHWPNSRARR